MTRAEYIQRFPAITSADRSYIIYSALLSCLEPQEVCSIFDAGFDTGTYKRRAFLKKIRYDLSNDCGKHEYYALFQTLYNSLEEFPAKKKRTAAAFIYYLYDVLPVKLKEDYFAYCFNSPNKEFRNRALKILPEWNVKLKKHLLSLFRLGKNEAIAGVLVEKLEGKELEDIAEEIILHTNDRYLASKLCRKLQKPLKEDLLESVKRKFPETYLYLLVKLRKTISEEEAYDLYIATKKTSSSWFDDGFLIWSLGKLGLWNVIMKIYEAKI